MMAKVIFLGFLLMASTVNSSSSLLERDLFKAHEIVRGLVVDIEPTTTDQTIVSLDVHYSLNHSDSRIKIYHSNSKDWQVGEQVVVFLDKISGKYQLRLGKIGKYVVRRMSEDEILFNEGSKDDYYSRMDWVMMQKLVRNNKKDFFQVLEDRTVFNRNAKTRKPASVEDIAGEDHLPGSVMFWIAIFFGMIGGLYSISAKVKD